MKIDIPTRFLPPTDWSTLIGFTGFSANPTVTTATYGINGNIAWVFLALTAGTSNAATFTITGLPINALNAVSVPCRVTDNGTVQTTSGMVQTTAGGGTISVGKNMTALGGFTASGTKNVAANLFFQFPI